MADSHNTRQTDTATGRLSVIDAIGAAWADECRRVLRDDADPFVRWDRRPRPVRGHGDWWTPREPAPALVGDECACGACQ